MRTKIFNKYVDNVCSIFSVDKKTLFTKNKSRAVVDARQLLYFLCHKRPMSLIYIQEYMKNNGYSVYKSTIHHGISIVTDKIKDEDRDYISAVKEILDEG